MKKSASKRIQNVNTIRQIIQTKYGNNWFTNKDVETELININSNIPVMTLYEFTQANILDRGGKRGLFRVNEMFPKLTNQQIIDLSDKKQRENRIYKLKKQQAELTKNQKSLPFCKQPITQPIKKTELTIEEHIAAIKRFYNADEIIIKKITSITK
tara:strand:+ start:1647 stop:2114 length:468 start_codon:yes stop_codon:yes gene_type:complete